MTFETPSTSETPAAPVTPVAAQPKRSFLKSTAGRVTLIGGVVLALGAGVAVAQQGWRHGGGMGPMGPGMMGGRGFERFCAADVGFVTQRMADGVTARLNLTDAQKPALADLRATAVRVAGDAKKLCADKADLTTVPGRLAVAQQRLAAANAAMTELKPKIEAFYGALNDEQKKTLDQMGPRGPRGAGRGWRQGDNADGPRGQAPGWRQGERGENRGWRQGETGERHRTNLDSNWNAGSDGWNAGPRGQRAAFVE